MILLVDIIFNVTGAVQITNNANILIIDLRDGSIEDINSIPEQMKRAHTTIQIIKKNKDSDVGNFLEDLKRRYYLLLSEDDLGSEPSEYRAYIQVGYIKKDSFIESDDSSDFLPEWSSVRGTFQKGLKQQQFKRTIEQKVKRS